MKTIYFISGLGADERVFKFLDMGETPCKHIKWEKPHNNEELRAYCKRLALQLDLSRPIVLVGVSFGGIVAQEIAKIVRVDKVIIVSSVKSSGDLGWQLKLVRVLKMHRLFSAALLKQMNLLTAGYYFSTKSSAEVSLLRQIIRDTDNAFMVWAINAIMSWRNKVPLTGIVHIHGNRDKIFPIGKMKDVVEVEGGGHFMIVNRAKEIAEIIKREMQIKI